jgi:hypothetical protein
VQQRSIIFCKFIRTIDNWYTGKLNKQLLIKAVNAKNYMVESG